MDIKTIEREAVSSAVIDFGIFNSEKNDYYIKGFLTGALWRINSVWHEPFEHPADGQYFVRGRATNASGQTHDAFDYYVTDDGKNYGMKCFYITGGQNVEEDIYEE